MFLPVLGAGASPLLDIGTGAGIPGLVLRLARPGWRVTLLDASRRRTNFLRDVTRRLGLVDVAVEHRRVEAATEVADQARFRTVTMRSVASAPEALRLARPFLRRDGRLVVAVGSRSAPPEMGRLAVVEWPAPGALPWRRRFLIITGEEVGETS
jgi:16S rRNA (guanine527-N7)-methyltransferase